MGAKIMVVDDDESFVDLARMIFVDHGLAVIEANDGETALRVIRRERPDIVLLDINLPGIDGYAVLEELKSDPATQDIQVIICSTTFRERSQIRKAMSLGAADYICKPLPPQKLYHRVSKFMTSL